MTSYLFPGQGSQIKGMGFSLFDEFQDITKKTDEILGYSIKKLCLENEDNKLNKTQYTQPALYVVNALTYLQYKKQTSIKPNFFAGHSLGEYNALQASGALNFEDGLKLVIKRGELMSKAVEGKMAAILNLTANCVQQCIDENSLNTISIANYNAPSQTVISGLTNEVIESKKHFEKKGAHFIILNTSGAFHSNKMLDARNEFNIYVDDFNFSKLQIPVIANVNAKPYEQNKIKENLVRQITNPVLWSQSMRYLFEQGETDFNELGVGKILTKLTIKNKEYFLSENRNKSSIDNKETREQSLIKQDKAETISGCVTEKESEFKINKLSNSGEVKTDHTAEQRITNWNKKYPVGSSVTVENYDGELETKTEAKLLFGHRAAIYIQGFNGYFSLDEVNAVN